MKRLVSLALLLIIALSSLCFFSCQQDDIFLYVLNKDKSGYIISAVVKYPLVVLDGNIIPEEFNGLPVTEIAAGGFAGWESLYSIVIPGSVEKIGNYAFGMTGIFDATIGEGTKYIDNLAFANSNVEVMYLPSTIEYIGEGAFANCSFFNNIVYNGTIEQWNAIPKGEGWCENMGGANIVAINCLDGVITFYSRDISQ